MSARTTYRILETMIALFVLLFVYAAFSKLADYQNFKDNIVFITGQPKLAALLANSLLIAEIVIALLLCINRSRLPGLYAFVALLLLFTAYIVYLLLSGRNLPCSCGGVISSLTWKQHLLFNACFLVAGIAAILLQRTIYLKQEPGYS